MKKTLLFLSMLAGLASCKKEEPIARREIQLVDGITNQPVTGVEVKAIIGCRTYSNPGFNASCTEPIFDFQTSGNDGKLALAENASGLFSSSHPDYHDVSKTSSMTRQQTYRLYPRAKANVTVQFTDEQGYQLLITSDAPERQRVELGTLLPLPWLFTGGNIRVEKKSGTGVIDLIADLDNEIRILHINGLLQEKEKIIRVKPGRGELMNLTVSL